MYALGAGRRYSEIPADDQGRFHSIVITGLWIDPIWFDTFPFPDELDLLHEMAPARFP